jgi:hypothetical protein
MRWNLDVFRKRVSAGWSIRTVTEYRFNLGGKVGVGSIPDCCGNLLDSVDTLRRCFPVSEVLREHCQGPNGGELILSLGDWNDSGLDAYEKPHFQALIDYVLDDVQKGYCKMQEVQSGLSNHVCRSASISRGIDRDQRSVDVVVATEDPVLAMRQGILMPEVILVSGVSFARPELPLLKDHVKSSSAIIGTVRDLRIDKAARVVRGRVYFSPTGEHQWQNTLAGHGLDVSIGASVEDQIVLRRGEQQTIEGKRFEGPMAIVTQCTMYELSVVHLGADSRAKMLV